MVPDRAYLFFYDRQGYRGLPKDQALAMHSHIADAFAEWIGRSAHFKAVPLLLETGQQRTTAAQERCWQRVRPLEEPVLPVPANESTSSGSSQLVGGIPTLPEAQEGVTEQEMPHTNTARPCRRQVKTKPAPGGGGGGRWVPTFLSRTARRSRLRRLLLQLASLVKFTGIGGAGEQRED